MARSNIRPMLFVGRLSYGFMVMVLVLVYGTGNGYGKYRKIRRMSGGQSDDIPMEELT